MAARTSSPETGKHRRIDRIGQCLLLLLNSLTAASALETQDQSLDSFDAVNPTKLSLKQVASNKAGIGRI
jgi:hypothetical protein